MQDIYFKEGDLVSHQGLGNGVVTTTSNSDENFPIVAQFSNGLLASFTIDGKSSCRHEYPSLLQGHDRFIAQPNKPIFEPKQGELVWGKYLDNWVVVYFIGYTDNKQPKVCVNPVFQKGFVIYCCSEIRPFKGEIPND